jgi:hypothetical protein
MLCGLRHRQADRGLHRGRVSLEHRCRGALLGHLSERSVLSLRLDLHHLRHLRTRLLRCLLHLVLRLALLPPPRRNSGFPLSPPLAALMAMTTGHHRQSKWSETTPPSDRLIDHRDEHDVLVL